MNTRWYLQREPFGGVGLVVEEREHPNRGILTPVTSRHEARFMLPILRQELDRRLAQLDKPVTTYDPEEP